MAPENENKQPENKGGGGGGGGQQQKKKPFSAEASLLDNVLFFINAALTALFGMFVVRMPGLDSIGVIVSGVPIVGMQMFTAVEPDIWMPVVGQWLFGYVIIVVLAVIIQWGMLMLPFVLGPQNLAWVQRIENVDNVTNTVGMYVLLVEWMNLAPSLRALIRTLVAGIIIEHLVMLGLIFAIGYSFNQLSRLMTKQTRT